MSPSPTVTKDQYGDRTVQLPMPYPTTELLNSLSKEIVVDWQMPTDPENNNN